MAAEVRLLDVAQVDLEQRADQEQHERRHFIVMELLQGAPLKSRIRGRPMDLEEVLELDHALARGEVGRVGVAISCLADMEQLLAELPLDRVTTSMTINATAPLLPQVITAMPAPIW